MRRSTIVEPEAMVECALVEIVGFAEGGWMAGPLVGGWNPDIPVQMFVPADAAPDEVVRTLREIASSIETYGLSFAAGDR